MQAPDDALTSIEHVRPASLVCSPDPARRPLQPSLKRFASASRPCARLSSCLAVAALPATAAKLQKNQSQFSTSSFQSTTPTIRRNYR
jgi:hypothetical protein